jgi:arylsulfatase A-like enzyme
VVVGDHGEGLLTHETREHGEEVYEEAVRVPLVLRFPGHLAPARIDAPVEMVDVAPTALELLGVARPAAFEGQSLVAAMRSGRADSKRRIFFQSEVQPKRQGNSFGVRAGRWKYIERHRGGELRTQLFDLTIDPGERSDVSEANPGETSRLGVELRAWRRRQGRPPAPPRLSEEDREALRALGYVQ